MTSTGGKRDPGHPRLTNAAARQLEGERLIMQCPNCGAALQKSNYLGLEVDRCQSCQGMWLDAQELDTLEDKAFAEDNLKGSLMTRSEATARLCPHCRKPLREFEYRINSLKLDYCEQGDGYWLDAHEAERVVDLMTQRSAAMERKFAAESDWKQMLQKFRAKSFWNRG
jgi:Zn-finger nucleic acid-binding protein